MKRDYLCSFLSNDVFSVGMCFEAGVRHNVIACADEDCLEGILDEFICVRACGWRDFKGYNCGSVFSQRKIFPKRANGLYDFKAYSILAMDYGIGWSTVKFDVIIECYQ